MEKFDNKLEKSRKWLSNKWVFVIPFLAISGYMLISNFWKTLRTDVEVVTEKDKITPQPQTSQQIINTGNMIINNQAENSNAINTINGSLKAREKEINNMQGSLKTTEGEAKNINTFYINNYYDTKFISKLEDLTKYKSLFSTRKNIIHFNHTGVIKKLDLSNNQFIFTGGFIRISIDDNECIVIEGEIGEIQLSEFSGTEEAINSKIKTTIRDRINKNDSYFIKIITKCLSEN